MSNKIYSAIPRTAEKITGVKGCVSFSWYFEGENNWVYYPREMNELALKKKRIEVEPFDKEVYEYVACGDYDYIDTDNQFLWRKEWLKDIREKSNE